MLTTIALLRSHLLYVLLILSAIKFVKLYLYFIYIYISVREFKTNLCRTFCYFLSNTAAINK